MVTRVILQQVWWLVGSFSFLIIFAVFAMRTFFVSLLGVVGVFFPIPCALLIMNVVCDLKYLDAINVIALFLICGIGADCLFIIFELYSQSKQIYEEKRKRLAYAAQRGLIALATSVSASAVVFLALLTSGVRIMNFFGVFSALLLLFTFLFTFTWYLAVMSIWVQYWDGPVQSEGAEAPPFSQSTSVAGGLGSDRPCVNYPHGGVFDFLRHKPSFCVDATDVDLSVYNRWERFVFNYLSPVIYLYRLPIVIVFLAWAGAFAYLSFNMGTKSELKVLSDDDPLQHGLTLASGGAFATSLTDFSYVYVWGIDPHPHVTMAEKRTITDYGKASYWDFNITDPLVQSHLAWTWQHLMSQDFIDPLVSQAFGVSPWETWKQLENLVNSSEDTFPWVFIQPLLEYIGLPPIPDGRSNITEAQWESYGWLFQLMLSALQYEEPDSYVPGTLKAQTIGFDPDTYKLRYIGMKANMKVPPDRSVKTMRALYNKCLAVEQEIQVHAREIGLPDFQGWFTGVAWLTMITEEKLPKQVIADVGMAIAFICVVVLISTAVSSREAFSTKNVLLMLFVGVAMLSTVFISLGFLCLLGWKIGCNEAIMISIAGGFCADFIIQPMLAMAWDNSGRSLFGKMQASLLSFCTPVGSALITTLVAAAFLLPCRMAMFPPFGAFLIASGLFGFIHGFIVLPAWIVLFLPKTAPKKDKSRLLAREGSIGAFTQDVYDADPV